MVSRSSVPRLHCASSSAFHIQLLVAVGAADDLVQHPPIPREVTRRERSADWLTVSSERMKNLSNAAYPPAATSSLTRKPHARDSRHDDRQAVGNSVCHLKPDRSPREQGNEPFGFSPKTRKASPSGSDQALPFVGSLRDLPLAARDLQGKTNGLVKRSRLPLNAFVEEHGRRQARIFTLLESSGSIWSSCHEHGSTAAVVVPQRIDTGETR